MILSELLAWARRHHRLARSSGLEDARAVLEELDASAPLGDRRTHHFEGALNSRDLFSVVKLVHVADNDAEGDEAWTWARVPRRRAAMDSIFERLNRARGARFDREALERLYEALLTASDGKWYPTFGFEYHPKTEGFPEISLYSEHSAPAAAVAAAETLGVKEAGRVRALAPAVHAIGFDFLAAGAARLKLYCRAEPSKARSLVRGLDPALRTPWVLRLTRLTPEGRFEDGGKDYVPLRQTTQGRLDRCSGEAFVRLTRGPFRRFADAVAPSIAGQLLSFVGASEEKIEIYFGKDETARRAVRAAGAGNVEARGSSWRS